MRPCNRCRTFPGVLLACLLSGVLTVVQAGDLELGMQALEMGYAQQAIELWRPLAKSGDVDAQFGMGVIYNDAMGVEQDFIEANYWFLRAAEQGHAPAQFNLGNAYKNGTGMSPDANMAVIWWRKAADQGFGPAQYNLGTAYLEGIGVARDAQAGLELYRRAAANGHPHAQLYLDEHAARQAPAADLARPDQVPGGSVAESAEPAAAPLVASAAPASRAAAVMATRAPAAADAVASGEPMRAASSAAATPAVTTADCIAWLQRGPERGYTLQLMTGREATSASDYVAQHHLGDTVICSYRVKGRVWHALLQGQHADLDGARAALAALPGPVRADGAYPRRLQEIRRAIEATP